MQCRLALYRQEGAYDPGGEAALLNMPNTRPGAPEEIMRLRGQDTRHANRRYTMGMFVL